MNLQTTHTFSAPPDKVYSTLTDPSVIQKCIDGCEKMVKTGEDSYDAHLKIGLSGLKGTYVGKVHLKDKNPPESYTLIVEGKGAPGFVKGTAKIKLTAKGKETQLDCSADAQVGGLIAAVGSRLIEASAKKMLDEFFRKFAQQVKN